MMMLNQFIHNLLKSSTVANYPGIQTMVEQFLEQRPEDKKALLSGHLVKTVDNLLFNPLKVVGNVVKTVPDNIFNTVDGVMDNISKVLGPSKPVNRMLVEEVSKKKECKWALFCCIGVEWGHCNVYVEFEFNDILY